jgi:multisubunit Na+/H+ antiporter MnhB subunit
VKKAKTRVDERSRDDVVQTIAWLLGCVQVVLSMPLYSWLANRAARRWNKRRPWEYFNYIYVGIWSLVFLGFAFAVTRVSGWGQTVIVSVALWRAAEILTWYVKLLFDKGHRVFFEVERNLFFLIVDSLTFVTVLAFMLESASDGDLSGRWSDAFSAFTLNGAPDGYGSSWATAVDILGAAGGLALLAAGLGIIVNLVSARIERAHDQPYGGPTPRPKPPWK